MGPAYQLAGMTEGRTKSVATPRILVQLDTDVVPNLYDRVVALDAARIR